MPSQNPAAWVLFLLLNASLFLRPAEIIPQLEDVPVYEVLILTCLFMSVPQMWVRLQGRRLRNDPITLCVLGLVPAIALSQLSHFAWHAARDTTTAFLKVVSYYVLLISLTDSETRLRQFLFWLCAFTLILTVLSLLDYHGLANLPAVSSYRERQEDQVDEETGETVVIARLRSTGIFNNPNDLARILVVGVLLSLYVIFDQRLGWWRAIGILVIAVFVHALQLTYSRGGLLALLGGFLGFIKARYSWRKTLGFAALGMAVLIVVFAGRQTNLTTTEGTGRQRIEIWREGIALFKQAPLFGIGMDEYVEEVGYVAHNSFVQCYTELGFIGGTLFFGAFYLACSATRRRPLAEGCEESEDLGTRLNGAADASVIGLHRLRPCLLGVVVSCVVGMMSSTRSYSLPTYMVLGVIAQYAWLSDRNVNWKGRSLGSLALRISAASTVSLALIYAYVQMTLN